MINERNGRERQRKGRKEGIIVTTKKGNARKGMKREQRKVKRDEEIEKTEQREKEDQEEKVNGRESEK